MLRLELMVGLMQVLLKAIVALMKLILPSPVHDSTAQLHLLMPRAQVKTILALVHAWIHQFMPTSDSTLRVTLIQQPPIHAVETRRLLSPGLMRKVECLVL